MKSVNANTISSNYKFKREKINDTGLTFILKEIIIMDEEYKMQVACKQVYTILNLYNQELLRLRIPKEVLDNLKNNSAKDYEYTINPNTFDSDTLTEEASALLLVLFDEYFANQTQKDKINRFLNAQNNLEHDSTLLFNSKKNYTMQNYKSNDIQKCNDLVVYESNIIKRIIEKIKSIFKK